MAMETLTAISVTVIAATMVVGLIFMIPLLLQIRRTAREAEKLIDTVSAQVAPVSRDIILISQDVKDIVESIRQQVYNVEDGIETVHDMVLWTKKLQAELKWRAEAPLLQIAAVMGGIKRGFEVMARMIKR
jgi:uncharacterized protein YoxC